MVPPIVKFYQEAESLSRYLCAEDIEKMFQTPVGLLSKGKPHLRNLVDGHML